MLPDLATRRRPRRHDGHRPAPRDRFAPLNAYPVRIMLGLAASLAVLVLCFRLPLRSPAEGIGWGPSAVGPPISLKDIREAKSGTSDHDGAPITSFDATKASATQAGEGGGRGQAPEAGATKEQAKNEDASEKARPARLPGLAPLHTLDRTPRAIGGIGGMYLKIDYPEAARRDSIEGRLFLRFVVEEDGSTSHVQVARSLHPLCDSAAVRAIERTRFLPGQRDGETVRVAMHLPVHFKLVDGAPLQASRSPTDDREY